jgi:hypothetical protein
MSYQRRALAYISRHIFAWRGANVGSARRTASVWRSGTYLSHALHSSNRRMAGARQRFPGIAYRHARTRRSIADNRRIEIVLQPNISDLPLLDEASATTLGISRSADQPTITCNVEYLG